MEKVIRLKGDRATFWGMGNGTVDFSSMISQSVVIPQIEAVGYQIEARGSDTLF